MIIMMIEENCEGELLYRVYVMILLFVIYRDTIFISMIGEVKKLMILVDYDVEEVDTVDIDTSRTTVDPIVCVEKVDGSSNTIVQIITNSIAVWSPKWMNVRWLLLIIVIYLQCFYY